MSIDRRNRITFEESADLFNEVRSGYPDELVENVLNLSGISSDGRILEIGCGPGNATLPYAQRGYRITAIELGKRLAELARQNLAQFPRVQVVNSSFEEWDIEEKAFHLAISAEAMHWIPPEIGYPKVAAALADQGVAAFYWNVTVDPKTGWSKAIDTVYRRLAPQVMETQKTVTAEWLTAIITENFQKSGRFGPVTVRQYPWSETCSTDQYIKLLKTYSVLRDLDAATKDKLFAAIQAIIEQHGGRVTVLKLTVLFLASVQQPQA